VGSAMPPRLMVMVGCHPEVCNVTCYMYRPERGSAVTQDVQQAQVMSRRVRRRGVPPVQRQTYGEAPGAMSASTIYAKYTNASQTVAENAAGAKKAQRCRLRLPGAVRVRQRVRHK